MKLTNTDYWNKLIRGAFTKFLILYTLRQSPSYAYQISFFIEELTQGIIAPTEGTLYPTLLELQKKKYVTVKKELVEGRGRKIYRLTRRGHKAYFAGLRTIKGVLPFLTRVTSE
jgi:PadR family transcriptional regulator PadR